MSGSLLVQPLSLKIVRLYGEGRQTSLRKLKLKCVRYSEIESGRLHTLKSWLSVIDMIKDLISLTKYVIEGVYRLFLNYSLDHLVAKSRIIAKESMLLRHRVDVFVQKHYARVL